MSKPATLFNRLALIGVGLIGSSIARAARAQGAARMIVARFAVALYLAVEERPGVRPPAVGGGAGDIKDGR